MSTQVYTEVYLLVPTSYTHLHSVSLKVFHQPQNQAQTCSFLLSLGSKRLRQLVFRLQSERGHQIPGKHPGVKAQETGFKSNLANIPLQVKYEGWSMNYVDPTLIYISKTNVLKTQKTPQIATTHRPPTACSPTLLQTSVFLYLRKDNWDQTIQDINWDQPRSNRD